MKFLNNFGNKYPRFGIPNLMMHIALLSAVVFVVQYLLRVNIVPFLLLERDAVLNMQLWRLVTFIFVPPSSGILFCAFSLYFYYFLGAALENAWGTARLTLFYLVTMLGTVIAAMITGGIYAGYYVNFSIFLASASVYPDMQITLNWIIPLKIKYLAYVYLAYLAFELIMAPWMSKFAILASLLGVIIFFSGDLYRSLCAWLRRQKHKRKFK